MILRKGIALLMSVLMVFTMVPALAGTDVSYADTVVIAKVNGKAYTSFGDLIYDVSSQSGKSVTIDMESDWNANGDEQFNKALSIPARSTVTLNMHGHFFNRDNSRNDDYGIGHMLVSVDHDAVLVINGGSSEAENKVEHKYVPVYSSTKRDQKASKTKTFYGGVLCGGNSVDSAGGIEIGGSCTVTLNSVTIAGCSANDSIITAGGYGDGIQMIGVGSNLRMNNSTISGCYANDEGAGIYVNQDACTVELNN